MRRQQLVPVGLLVAAVGLLGLGVVGPPTSDGGIRITPGVPILLVAAGVSWWWRGRPGAVLGLVAVAVVTVASLGAGLGPDLIGDRGLPVAVMRWVQVVGLVAATYALVRRLAVRPVGDAPDGPDAAVNERPGPDRSRVLQVVGLLLMCGIGAELLAAYGDSTGNVGGIAFALVFFGALYGTPALVARELVRRLGWGWPSLLLIFAALGVAEAGLIDQSLFSADYGGYAGWEENREPTLIPSLGFSGYNAYSFIIGHVIFSFAAPVALAEAWVPARARKPWLGPIGTALAAVAYVIAALLILFDPESRSGSPTQLLATAGVIVVLLLVASVLGRRAQTPSHQAGAGEVSLRALFVTALVFALVPDLTPATWLGVAIATTTTVVFGVLVLLAARTRVWTVQHAATIGAAYLVERGLLAFTYFPLIGDVAAVPKYAHNLAMLLVVALAGWLALRGRAATAPPAERTALPAR